MDSERPMAMTAAKGIVRLDMIGSRGSARIHQATALVMGAQIRIGKTILELRP